MKNRKTNLEDIDYILDNFDFEKAKKVMDALDWVWWDAEEGVPSIVELISCARNLLKEAFSKGVEKKIDYFVGTEGFKANYFKDTGKLELSFVVEDYSNIDLINERDGG